MISEEDKKAKEILEGLLRENKPKANYLLDTPENRAMMRLVEYLEPLSMEDTLKELGVWTQRG